MQPSPAARTIRQRNSAVGTQIEPAGVLVRRDRLRCPSSLIRERYQLRRGGSAPARAMTWRLTPHGFTGPILRRPVEPICEC